MATESGIYVCKGCGSSYDPGAVPASTTAVAGGVR
jgi:ribosomal protein L37AE/L43A